MARNGTRRSDAEALRMRRLCIRARLTHLRRRIERRSGLYQGDLVAKAREERAQEMERVARGE
ncbi:MAG: hypothetical protein HPY83_17350 [Anaerolineae bacterium]|nr:hypothetical protein [Anaerolineae bacterium]